MVNDILPYESLSLLNMKHFSCLTAPKYLQEFLDANLMTENSFFQISSMAFEFLLIQFLHYDFSVSNFGVSYQRPDQPSQDFILCRLIFFLGWTSFCFTATLQRATIFISMHR